MSAFSTADILAGLIARSVISAEPPPRALSGGNADRLDRGVRSAWIAALPDGGLAKLTLGPDLESLAAHQAEFNQACPPITPARLFFERTAAGDALAEAFFDGAGLADGLRSAAGSVATAAAALARIRHALAASEQASNEPARLAEWRAWCDGLLALPVWSASDHAVLREIILPALYPRIAAAPPVTRWTNGDFLPGNILLNAAGEARLIDAEFASRTHFFAEDAVRFRVLSTLALEYPGLEAALPPPPPLAWHLYFWLRQFQLEATHNTPEYLARFHTARLGLIRRLSEHVLAVELPDWSVPSLSAPHRIEDIRWSAGGSALVGGWCCPPASSPLRGIHAVAADGRLLAAVPPVDRPDVQQHFGGAPHALASGFTVSLGREAFAPSLTLCAQIDQATLLPLQVLAPNDLPRGALCWDDYAAWAAQSDPNPPPPAADATPYGPLFSVLLPVYRTPARLLRECVESVRAQHYARWELCAVDDGSASPEVSEILRRFAAADARIRVQTRAENGGISRATNDALAMAGGEFAVLLDHDDLFRPHTLLAFATELAREPAADVLYSDEDKITDDGRRIQPFLKPAFSPEFLRGVMYAGHALCVRTALARAAGGFDPAFDGVQDFEFLLRVSERTRRIRHLPRILYHWRQAATSSALHGNIKGDMDARQAAAVQAHLARTGDPRRATALGGHRVRLTAPSAPVFARVQVPRDADPLPLLLEAARSNPAEVLVAVPEGVAPVGESDWNELAALAARPDSACVAPLLLSANGRVAESGRAGRLRLMHEFHAGSDGYHGSLRCNREVDAVSPACFALRRSLLLDQPPPSSESWPDFCQRLRSAGQYHRVCASARFTLPGAAAGSSLLPAAEATATEFYNPQFDPEGAGDYSLRTTPIPPVETPAAFQFHLDQPTRWDRLPRCVIIRGWCFATDGGPVQAIRLRAGPVVLSGVLGLPRPDVKAALSAAPDDGTGFEIRGTLPAGRHRLQIEARSSDDTWHELAASPVTIEGRILPLWLGGGDWTELMFFQMPAHMAHPARPVTPERFPARRSSSAPKFSIVTPSFNQARFLPETMRSVLDQPSVTCDYVVQDGGSTDGSADLIRAQAERLKAWASEPDAGQADAIARGFARTAGGPDDLMAYLNSDDFYLPGALAFVADYFACHPEVDVLYGHRVVVDEESREIARWFLPRHDPEVLRLNDFIPQETMFWRRRIWDRVGGLDTSFKFALDWDLLLRFQGAGARIVRVPYFLACFRVHAAQKTSARMHDLGAQEITRLRERAQGRPFPAVELEQNPRLLRYLRRSAFIGFLWRCGLRAP